MHMEIILICVIMNINNIMSELNVIQGLFILFELCDFDIVIWYDL